MVFGHKVAECFVVGILKCSGTFGGYITDFLYSSIEKRMVEFALAIKVFYSI